MKKKTTILELRSCLKNSHYKKDFLNNKQRMNKSKTTLNRTTYNYVENDSLNYIVNEVAKIISRRLLKE